MKKVFSVNLKSVEYLGDAIGNDIFLEIKINNQVEKFEEKTKHKAKKEINKEIAYFETEEKVLELPVDIKITEDDILFDDVGSVKGLFKIDLLQLLPQIHVFEIKVNEKRGASGKRVAIFKVVLEAIGPIRYIKDVDRQGWLKVLPPSNKKEDIFSIPIYLKVQIDHKDDSREYFTILEGARKNTKASVSLKEDGLSRFSKINPYKKAVNLTYSISKKILKYKNQLFRCDDDPNNPWQKGIYNI